VAVGCSADLIISPFGALIIGFVAGTISTFGFKYLTPYLERRIALHDTAGIHNLHAMPGVLGGLTGIFSALRADDTFGIDYVGIAYPLRAPANLSLALQEILDPGIGRTGSQQAGFQAAGLITSMAIGIAGGIITSAFLRCPCVCRISDSDFYLDGGSFHELPADYPGQKLDLRTEIDETHLHEVKEDTIVIEKSKSSSLSEDEEHS